jgi:hypothetical protein
MKKAYNHEALHHLNHLYVKNRSSVQWVEDVNRNSCVLGHNQMIAMHNQACEILHRIIPPNASTRDKIIATELWLAQNVKYDHAGFQNTDHQYTENGKALGPKLGTNSAFNALMYNSCVCEGYTRAEQYMLALCGIQSFNVTCRSNTGAYHSILRIRDFYDMYSDPCWNACLYQKGDKSLRFTLCTKNGILKDHRLSLEEKLPSQAPSVRKLVFGSYPDKQSCIQASVKANQAFTATTAGSVKLTREEISLNASRIPGAIYIPLRFLHERQSA